jgi:hypothetical protein
MMRCGDACPDAAVPGVGTRDERHQDVSRHLRANPPPRRVPARPAVPAARPERGRPSSRVALGVVAALSAGLLVLTLGALVVAGVDLRARGSAAEAAEPEPTPSASTAALVQTPAEEVVIGTLSATIRGWTPAAGLTWSAGTPFDEECDRPEETDATVAASRVYTADGRQVILTVAAYPAGLGPVALAGWGEVLGECSGPVGRVIDVGPGTESVTAWIRPTEGRPGAAVLIWRRGDVLASVALPTSDPDGLAERAADVDPVLLAVLRDRCADISSRLADAARSPYVDRTAFTGRTVDVSVTVPPVAEPTPPPEITPAPPGYSPAPLPSVSFPTRPAEPVWPADLPTPVGSPVPPASPSPAPVATVVPSRAEDPSGPGCGWAFTGMVAPPYDAALEAELARQRVEQAQGLLLAEQAQWQEFLVGYWAQVPFYEEQAALFSAYAAEVAEVAAAWDLIVDQREAYDEAVEAYNAAVIARDAFLAEQAAARVAYETALAACQATASPTPTPTPTPTPSPTSTDPFAPTPTPTPTPSAGSCPPPVPEILLQAPPELPPLPTPPPDPRPTTP